jgi:hypothetical protein
MKKVAVETLPEGFHVEGNEGPCTVIYDVTEESYGTWTGCVRSGPEIHLFPERSYRHKDLLKRLGLSE